MMQLVITVTVTIVLMYLFRKNNRKIRRAWGALQLKLLGIKLEIEGSLDNDANLLVMNHQSLLDIIVFEYLHQKDLAWVAKKEIADIPWFGHILKAPNMIIVERENKSSLIKLLREAKEKYNQNRLIAIFPEGTRTDGKKLRKFKAGTKLISEKHNFKVQPIVMIGTKDMLDSHSFEQKAGTVKIICLPTVQADKKTSWYEDMQNDMRQILEKEVEIKDAT